MVNARGVAGITGGRQGRELVTARHILMSADQVVQLRGRE